MGELPPSSANKLIRRSGNNRVSKNAQKVLSELLSTVGEEISAKALEIANSEKRKTVTARDIRLAKKEVWD